MKLRIRVVDSLELMANLVVFAPIAVNWDRLWLLAGIT